MPAGRLVIPPKTPPLRVRIRRGGRFCPPCMTAAPCRAGPVCPAAGYAFFGGTHGSRPTEKTDSHKNNAAPLAGRRAFSVHVSHRRRRVIFAAFTSGNRGGFHLKAERALTYLETTYHVFFTSPLYTFNENMQARLFPQSHQGNQKAQGELVPFDCPSARGRRGWK